VDSRLGRSRARAGASALAEEILAQLDEARDGYVPKLAFETSRALLPPQARRLPLRG